MGYDGPVVPDRNHGRQSDYWVKDARLRGVGFVELAALDLAFAAVEIRPRGARLFHVGPFLFLGVGDVADDLADDVATFGLLGFRRVGVNFVAEVAGRLADAGGNQVLPMGYGAVGGELEVGLKRLLLQAQVERAAGRTALFEQVF